MGPDLTSNAWDHHPDHGRSHAWLIPGLLLWFSFGLLYIGTTALDILAADAGEFQLVAASWGIAHPPGYPLYSFLTWLWTRLVPIGSIPFRANAFSALLAATTLWLIWRAVAMWAKSLGYNASASQLGGMIAALSLGSATTFWHQATTANIRMPTILFTAWGFLALARYTQAGPGSRRQRQALHILALATGMGVGHHPSLGFVALGWLLGLIVDQPNLVLQPKRWWRAVVITMCAWLLPQLLLPLRDSMSGVPLAPGDLGTWHGFWDHVLARGFGGDMFAYANRSDLMLRIPLLPTLFRMQFPVPVLLLMIGGSIWGLFTHGKLTIVLLTTWLIHAFVTITYRAPQTVEYLMPAYVPMVVMLGIVIADIDHRLTEHRRRRLRRRGQLVKPIVVGLFLIQMLSQVDDFAVLSLDTSIRERTEPLLRNAKPEALILADWRWATPLWTLQSVERLGTDVKVDYVVPENDLTYEEVWRQRADETGNHQLYTTHRYHWENWSFIPLGGGYYLARRPSLTLPTDLKMTPLDVDLGPLHLLGYDWIGDPAPGRTLELRVMWRASDIQSPEPSFTARLWDAEESLLVAKDLRLGIPMVDGEIQVTNLQLQLPIDRCSDLAYPTLGAYTVQDGNFQELGSVSLPPVAVECAYPKLPTRTHRPGWVANRGPFLRGVDYDARGNQSARMFLHWCGPGPALTVTSESQSRLVKPLQIGECQTTVLATTIDRSPQVQFTYRDGRQASLISAPLPIPRSSDHYLPFGDQMVLTHYDLTTVKDEPVLNLFWLSTSPIVADYAVSVRLHNGAGAWVGMHDMQPGIGGIPTLKWVTRGLPILDPHPFELADDSPSLTYASVVIYERFRLTPLSSMEGEVSTLPLP